MCAHAKVRRSSDSLQNIDAGWQCRNVEPVAANTLKPGYGISIGWLLLLIFAAILVVMWLLPPDPDKLPAGFSAFYRAGPLVFGGGHVVLPRLEETVVAPGWVSVKFFLGRLWCRPGRTGPVAFGLRLLGAQVSGSSSGITGALVALTAIFLPGFVLVAGALPLQFSARRSHLAGRCAACNGS